jgi:hypothetical protein
MIRNSDVQAGWIAKLKANTVVTALVPAVEVREESWKGTDFTYPNIRVKLGNLTPQNPSKNCQIFNSEVSIQVYSEQKSSKQADDIAGVIAEQFWGTSFTSNGVRFANVVLDALVPATPPEDKVYEKENVWMASVDFTAAVQNG